MIIKVGKLVFMLQCICAHSQSKCNACRSLGAAHTQRANIHNFDMYATDEGAKALASGQHAAKLQPQHQR